MIPAPTYDELKAVLANFQVCTSLASVSYAQGKAKRLSFIANSDGSNVHYKLEVWHDATPRPTTSTFLSYENALRSFADA